MRYKKIMMLTIIITCLLAISAVSAADNATGNIVSVEETTQDVVKETTDEVVSAENDNQIISANESDWGTFDDLAKEINAIEEGGVLNLTKDYKYVNGSTQGINIEKPITIDGKGHTLDGNYMSRIVYVDANEVILKNINFVNGFPGDGSVSGDAICWYGDNGVLINCSLSNCNHSNGGSTVDWGGSNGILANCSFVNSFSVTSDGGAVYWYGDNGVLANCSFVNSTSFYKYVGGGAVSWRGLNGVLANCSFVNSYAKKVGGAINLDGDGTVLINCSFVNSYSDDCGGAVYWSSDNGVLANCSFVNSTSFYKYVGGGAVSWRGLNGVLANCSFVNSYAKKFGGAIYLYGDGTVLINCSFVNSYSDDYGGAVYWQGDNGVLVNCSFYNNSAKEGNAICWVGGNGLINCSYFSPNFNSIYDRTSDLKMIKFYSSLSCENISFEYHDNVNMSSSLNICGKIIFNVFNEYNYKMFIVDTTNEGIATLYNELIDLTVGIWNVTVTFEGNDNYAPCNATATITVLPPSSSVTISDVNATVGQEVSLVSNVNSTLTVNEGIVTFFDGETEIGSANVVAGVATLNYVPTTIGNHIITAVYYSDNYKSSNDTAYLSVAKANTNINIESIYSNYFSNPTTITVNINSNNNDVKEGEVKFYVNDVLVKIENVYNGKVSIDYVANAVGSLKLTVIYNGTENYFASNTTTHFYVNQMPTTLSAESMVFDEQSYKTFVAELKDIYSRGVPNQTVKIELIKYSGESATFTAISNDEGIAVFDIGNLAGGMWYVTGIYNGNNNYIGSEFVDKFIVVKVDTTTSIDGINNPQINHAYKIKANIHDENGKLVKEGVVRFYLDGVDIGSIDLSENNGHQSVNNGLLGAINSILENKLEAATISDSYINYIPKKVGKHTLTAVYEGTSIYKSSKSTTTFVVKNSQTVKTTLTLKKVTVKRSAKKLTIQATLKVNGKAAKGKIIKFKFNKKSYKAKTNAKGVAKITVKKAVLKKLKKGKKITYAATYGKITKKVTVKVKK